MILKIFDLKKGSGQLIVRLFIGEKGTQTSEDQKVCRHGLELLIQCMLQRSLF